jgi:excinuclease ABC subunit A
MPVNTIETIPRIVEPVSRRMELRGVRVHNLKNIDLDLPLGQLVVLSGVSGSGKSSLAFDTLYAEGQRRYIESFSISARQHLERIDRPDADRITHVPPAIAIRSDRVRRQRQSGRSTVGSLADVLDGLRLLFSRLGKIICPNCRQEIRSQSAADVVQSISAMAAGTRCQIGFYVANRKEKNQAKMWLARGFSRAIWDGVTHDLSTTPANTWPKSGDVLVIIDRIVAGKVSAERLFESAEAALREGEGQCTLLIDANASATEASTRSIDGRPWNSLFFRRDLTCTGCDQKFLPVEPRLFSHFSSGACLICKGTGRSADTGSTSSACLACEGTRFRDEARAVKVAHKSIADLCCLTAADTMAFVHELSQSLDAEQLQRTELIRNDIQQRLNAVRELGLDYLTLDRSAETLSGGEARRLMLAAVIGSRITGTLVVVDEPSAGLATNELPKLIVALRRVQELRNSVIVVDHAPAVVASADYVVELGPGAGPAGGNIVYLGPPVRHDPSESTEKNKAAQRKLSSKTSKIRLSKIQHHNLHDYAVDFPLRKLSVVTGPSGSGKTSLVTQVLYPAICKQLGLPCQIDSAGTCELSGGDELVDAVLVDQSPLTKSSRSNPATWLEVFDEIRKTFAGTADAKQRGFTAQHFSFNSSSGGRCRSCLGTGLLKHAMQFLPDVTLVCPECNGTRYRPELLDIKYRGRSIADVLSMSVSDAATFFRSQPRVQYRFQLLKQIGLDYLVLGQPSETLSGGEAQRLKLAARLAMPSRGPSLIICDEPTTGLHPIDVAKLISCFRELIANGHTLVLADNSPELLNAADYVVEILRPFV